MAEDFLNCGNIQLEEAAKNWAEENGYSVVSSGFGGGPIWGSGQ